ncbi:MAG: endonuclease/exonuclease/phosphatase family protein [Myxococcota bacterium]
MESTDRLRIGCLNVWGLPEPFAEDVTPRMRAITRALRDSALDLVVLQEVWTPGARKILREGAREAGYVHQYAAPSQPGGGLLLLSRRPFEAPRFERFEFRGDLERIDRAEYLGGKGFLAARLSTRAGPLWIVDTHLHARYRHDASRIDSGVRVAQLMQIVEFLHATPEPVVVAGDFNCEPGDPEYQVWTGLTGARDVTAGPRALPTICRSNHYKSHRSGPDKRIDFVFVSQGAATRVDALDSGRWLDGRFRLGDEERPYSDHYGLSVELAVRPAAALAASHAAARAPAVAHARDLLRVGRSSAHGRERSHAQSAGVWAGASALALLASQDTRLGRRRFLKRTLLSLGGLALAPAAGLTTVARIDAPDQARAFERALLRLERLDRIGSVAESLSA